MNIDLIPCADEYLDCPYFDPDACPHGECVLEQDWFWEENGYYQNEEKDLPFVFYDEAPKF